MQGKRETCQAEIVKHYNYYIQLVSGSSLILLTALKLALFMIMIGSISVTRYGIPVLTENVEPGGDHFDTDVHRLGSRELISILSSDYVDILIRGYVAMFRFNQGPESY
jgi:hypothetical protein